MLDVTTNQNINCTSAGAGTLSSGGLLDDVMDPLFDNDWLHEHNLDILFDLFEEEMERKDLDHTASTNSSTIFGTSPVTSYLFGTSPSLASALDLYDLLYFDNQQQPITPTQQQQASPTQQQQTTTPNVSSTSSSSSSSSTSIPTATTTTTNNINTTTTTTTTTIIPTPIAPATNIVNINSSTNNIHANKANTFNNNNINGSPVITQQQQQQQQQVSSQKVSTNHIANSIANAMRIKRGLKRGQNEGISLLARPLDSNAGCSNSNNISILNKNNSDKTSTKITNLRRPIVSSSKNFTSSNVIDIDRNNKQRNRHNHNYHQQHHHHHHHHQVHFITGCAVIREHAYAVRGH